MLSHKALHATIASQLVSNHFEQYFQRPKDGHIGAEFEFPILSTDEKPWSSHLIPLINDFITNALCFQPSLFAAEEPIAFVHPVYGDKISYEVTHSTLEFSLSPKKCIPDLEASFLSHFLPIQAFLLKHNLFLGCVGLHPFEYHQSHPVLEYPHYQNIDQYLRKCSKINKDQYHRAPSKMIGSQTHVEVTFNQIYKYQNVFQSLGWLESKLMANSYFNDGTRTYLCYRDVLLRKCGFGYNPENVCYSNQYFNSNNDFFKRFLQKSIFTKKLRERCHHFLPIPLYELPQTITHEQSIPRLHISLADLPDCLAFNPVRMTPYGTLEIRSACQQPFGDLFAPVAFQVAIHHCADELLDIIPKTWAQNSEDLRLHANLNKRFAKNMRDLIPSILKILKNGLAARNFGEEKYLDVLIERFFSESNPAHALAKIVSQQKSVTEYLLQTST